MLLRKTAWLAVFCALMGLQAVAECSAHDAEAQAKQTRDCQAIEAAREAEAHALQNAPQFSKIEEFAYDIYDGPALMASYQGDTVEGVYSGYGVLTLPDSNMVLAGVFADGLLNGPGVERDMQGTVYYEGIYKDGVPVDFSIQSSNCAEPR